MKKRGLAFLAAVALVVSCVSGCGGNENGSGKTEALTKNLEQYGLEGLTELTVGELEAVEVDSAKREDTVTLTTDKRSVSHGNVHTAYVTVPLMGEIHQGDTVVVRFKMKNEGSAEPNFLVDLYKKGDEERRSWLSRNPIFLPGNESYEEYYFYGFANEDTDTAMFEISMGWAAQSLSLASIQAAVYPGTVKEQWLEALPNMARFVDGENIWYNYYGWDEEWREIAEKMIEQNRKGTIKVNVTDADGNAVSDADVQISMREHSYLFGTSTSADTFVGEDREARLSTLKDYFNVITLANDLKWEREEVNEDTYAVLEYLSENGMKVHGHVLLWPGTDRDPYDDGVDNKAEFVTTPEYVVSYVHVIQAMQKMNDPRTGYGDGTIGALREEIDGALETFDSCLENLTDEVAVRHVTQMRDSVLRLKDAVTNKPDGDTSLEGVKPDLAEFQAVLRSVVIEHVSSFASYYGEAGAIVEWDAFNEIFNVGYRGVTNALGEDAGTFDGESVAADGGTYENPIFVDVLNAASEASGGLPLSFNDVSWQSNSQQREWTYNFMSWLKAKNAPIGFMGLQAYMYPQSISSIMDPEETWTEYDRLAGLGIQTEITEYALTGFDGICDNQEMLDGLKSDFLHDYILENYAHPGSRGYIAWGGIPTDGPVSSVYYKLVYDKLWTDESVQTGADGTASVDAFLGTYEITVVDKDGNQKTVSLEHENGNASGNETVVEVRLD
jgi:GH35 family endo-1,4-beta-xylanase